jgi:phosphoglycolate phosphatase-like HAD superfamily hydrolase
MKLLLFDLDGTILHAKHERGREPFRAVMREMFAVDVDWSGVRPDGKTDPSIIAELLERAGAPARPDAATLRAFERALALRTVEALARGTTRVDAVPGVRALLEAVAPDPRFALGVLTGNLEQAAHLKLRAAGLAEFFAVGAFGSDAAARAALPEIARARFRRHSGADVALADCVIVGDTPLDHAAAAENGMACVLIASGRTPLAELARLEPAAVFPDWSDTRAILDAFARLCEGEAHAG